MILIGKYPSIKLPHKESIFIKFKKFDKKLVDLVKSLPIRYYIPEEKVWEVPISDIDRIVFTFGKENISVFNDIPEYIDYIKSLESKKQTKEDIEKLKEYYKTIKPIVDFEFKSSPRGHQIEAFNIGIKQNCIIITDIMGLGKTASSLYITDYRIKNKLCDHCLVVCCINGNKYNWVKEISKHSWYNCQVIDGTKKQRLEKIDDYWMFKYNIINIESLRDEDIITKLIDLVDSGKINTIIVDEFHKALNRKSQQGGNLVKLNPKYKIGLSGTPLTKRLERAWSILNWMGVESSSEWKFKKRYCIFGGYTGWQVIGYKNVEELHAKIDSIQLRRTKDILNLPPKTREYRFVEMTKTQKREYDLIKSGILHDLETGNLQSLNPSVVTLKLRQYTDKIKYEAVKQTVEELNENDEPCVIFSCYRQSVYDLAELLKEYNPLVITGDVKSAQEKQKIVDEFQNNKKHKVILGTIDALGTGFTLTRSSYVLFLNKHYVQPYNEQAEDRCHRIGSTKNVTCITFIVKDTVDEKVEQILESDKIYIDMAVDGKLDPRTSKDLINQLLGD